MTAYNFYTKVCESKYWFWWDKTLAYICMQKYEMAEV